MKTAISILLTMGAALGLLMATMAPGAPLLSEGRAEGGPIVLELFTSQGCSSCPPADRLLRAVGEQPKVIALSFHVDYWNHLGWRDPFSDARWSGRQEAYARRLAGGRLYTPQLVVNGLRHFVGSDRASLERALEGEQGLVALEVEVALAEGSESRLEVRVDVPPALSDTSHRVLLAVTESGLETAVASGENSRRELRHDHVVRSLVERRLSETVRAELPTEPSWQMAALAVVVLVENQRGAIVAAGRQSLAARSASG